MFAGGLVLVILFLLPEVWARTVIMLLMLIAAYEWSGLLGVSGNSRYLFLLLVALLIVPALVTQPQVDYQLVFQGAAVWWVLALIWTFFYPTRVPVVFAGLAGLLIIVPAWLALDSLYVESPKLLLFMLGIVLCADIGAFFAGRAFGRVKLAPAISPGKTWEGVIGGLVMVSALVIVISQLREMPLGALWPMALAVAMVSVLGDLTVSMFKRNAGVKDSGRLFPGHGGFLDRADSITAAAPIFALAWAWGLTQ